MKKYISISLTLFLCISIMAGCNAATGLQDVTITGNPSSTNTHTQNGAASPIGTDNDNSVDSFNILSSYYAAQDASVFDYFQDSSIQSLLTSFVENEIEDIENLQWNYDSFTSIEILDHDFEVSRPEEQLYCLTFSDGAGQHGYIILIYEDGEESPQIRNWGVTETTPHQYDLWANFDEITISLENTDIDLSTATAARVYFYDRDKKRADQVILFTDAKDDKYICYFGYSTFEIEKF